jgi:VCBS repeat-containing protein
MSTIPAFTFGGITRPALILDPSGNIILDPAAQAFLDTYGTKALYAGVPPGTHFPPIPDLLTTPVDTNGTANSVAEGAAVNTLVGITASSHSLLPFSITYSLSADSSSGGFKIDPTTGVVSVANSAKIDFESSPGHAYTVTVQATDGIFTTSQNFTIGVSDVAPSTPVDGNAATNTIAEGAAVGTAVGVTAHSTDINGGTVTYSLTGDTSGGGFTVNAATGVVTVADSTKIDYETAPGHAYSVTVQASDGTLTSATQTFTIAVSDVPLPTPADTNPAANQVAEGAAAGTLVGLTATANDPNGPTTTYSLIGDTSGGGFTIDPATGVVTVADPAKIDFESAAGHAYSVTVKADDGLASTTQTFSIAVTDVAPSAPTDSDASANTIAEGAANGSTVGITAHSTDVNGPAVTYSLVGDTSGGGFTINAATGVITVADSTKIDYETSPGHAYTVTAQASDGTLASSQTFTIGVTDVPPSNPVDSNAAANAVAEGAAAGATVGITASSTDVNGPAVTYSLTGDTSGGGFTINSATGVVTVADPTKIDYESSPGHAYSITVQSSDGTLTSSQVFTIGVNDVAPSTPVDSDATANAVAEGAAAGTNVGITAHSVDVNGPAVTYSLVGDTSGGGFTINSATGVVTVADPTKIDFESSGGSYTVVAQSTDGTLTNSQAFVIAVTDVAPSTPVDSNAAANTIAEGAAAGSTVGITASSTDVNGPAVTYSLVGDTSGGGFTINATTGVVTVADPTKIDYESAPGHAYTVTSQASDGTLTSSQAFTIAVTDVAPSVPVDSDAAANAVTEGAPAGSTVGVTASSTDVNGPPVTYSLTGDTSGGGFTINATTGVVTVADPSKIDYESAPGHAYSVTVTSSDGTMANSQVFTIAVNDAAPSTPVDSDAAANTVVEGAAAGTTVGVTASSTDVNGPAVTYSLTGDTSGGGFTINAATGVVTVADPTKIDFESTAPGHTYTVTATASDGTLASSQIFTIAVTDAPPSTPVDSDGAINQVSQNAPVGTYTGLTASSTDVNGPAVTYSLVGDTSGGGFAIDASTGKVTVADSTKIPFNAGSPSFDVTVQSSDGTDTSQQTFTINVIQNTPPVANDDSLSATEAGGLNNSIPGSNPSGNVILGTGSAGAVQDTDAQDPSTALTVVAVHTGPEGGSTGTGTVGSPIVGLHGTLTLDSHGAYTYTVNQTDPTVQALHTAAETITDQFNYTIQDTGGLQDTATITFTIHGADDLPQAIADTGTMTEDDAPTLFNVLANDTLDPDHTALNTIAVGPGSITVTGPAGETFANTDATATVVSNEVQVSLNNAHFQQLAVGEHATITVPYTLTGDTGETSTANLVVTVNGVNDVPVAVDDSGSMTEDQSGHAFTVLSNDTLDPDHGAPNNVTAGAVTNLSAPAGEGITTADIGVSVNASNQVVVNLGANFQHMQDGQTATFDVAYTLHGDQPGDTSTAELHVTVTGVNDAPVAGNFTFNGVNSATGNTDLIVNDPATTAITETTPNKTISASLLSGASDVDGPGPLTVVAGTIATAHGGSVTMQSDGDFIYKPPVGYTGSDSFNYQVSDQNTGASGVGLGTGTVTINVAAPKVWYVNADAATDGDGSSEHPFNNLTHFNGVAGVDGTGDTIVLETATAHYTGGLTLENNEQLISQSAGVTINGTTLFAASGANAVVDGGVVLGSGNTIEGVDFGTTSGFAVSGSSVGTLHLNDTHTGVINNSSGGGISIGGASNVLNVDFNSITTGGGTNGIALTNSSGTFHAHGGTISNASGADVALNGGTVTFTDDGAISDSTGTVVSVANMTGNTQAFTGAIGTTGSTDGAIALSSNTGATINFSGGMALSTGASDAFSATGGGTVNVTGTNHLTTTTGTALNISNTTIGSSNVTFHDISSNGGSSNGIILVNTGSSGGLHVTGDGSTAASGGTIANKTGADGSSTQGTGVFLNNTHDVELAYMQLNDFSNFAIRGNNVTGFTLDHSVINGDNGTSNSLSDPLASFANVGEDAIRFTNLLGSGSITNSTISGGYTNTIMVENNTGILNRLTIDHSTIGGRTDNGTGMNDGINFQADTGSTAMNLTVTNSALTTARANLIAVTNQTGTQTDVKFDNNTLTNNHPLTVTGGTAVDFAGLGGMTFDISNNTFDMHAANSGTGIKSNVIEVNKGSGSGSSTFDGTISGNTIGVAATAHSGSGIGANDIDINSQDNGIFNILVQNNILTHYDTAGIQISQISGSSTVNATVIGNTTSNGDSNAFAGLYVVAGSGLATDNGVVNLKVGGTGTERNDFSNGDPANGSDVFLQQSSPSSTSVFNLTGSPATNNATLAAITASIQANNLNPGTTTVGTSGTINLVSTTPTLPLLAAPGGVQASSPTTGEMHLTQSELDSVVAAAIAQWAAAGASASQLAALHAATFSVADLSGSIIGDESSPAHITIDTDAAGHGWFIDPTPSDNSEFTHAQNAAGTDLLTDPTNAAAGHLDLLTTVSHEMGHVLGLPDSTSPSAVNDLMYVSLVDGERRLPDAADVAQANGSTFSFQAVGTTAPVVTAAPVLDAGHGGGTLVGTAGADNFVFANVDVHGSAPPPITHVANYSFAQGDTFDFSVLTSQLHGSGVSDALVVRAIEGAGGSFATLQVNTADSSMGSKVGSNWVSVAQIDGAHAGDALNVLVDTHSAVHASQIHVDLLV